jgi:hypothetical protein
MKEELHKDMGSLKKKMNETEILEIKSSSSQKKKKQKQKKNTVESHSSVLEQMKDRFSGFEDKTDRNGKTEED